MPDPDTGKFKVMVVDDSRTSLEVIQHCLKDDPLLEVMIFEEATEALTSYQDFNPDIILSDAQMPHIDGFSLCKLVRQQKLSSEIPFLLITATINEIVKAKAESVGVTRIIEKPFKKEKLLDIINEYTGTHTYSGSALIVDDMQSSRLFIKRCIKPLGVRVFEAKSPEAAEEILLKQAIDIIYIDNVMEDASGVTWCKTLRKHKRYKDLPIIGLCSGSTDGVSFIRAGADDYLLKESAHDEIEVRTRNLLRRTTLTRELKKSLEAQDQLIVQKNHLLGTAAHDIRNPLSVIIGFAELLQDDIEDDPFKREMISEILQATTKALDLLNETLDISSIENGTVSLEKAEFELIDFLKERLDTMNELGRKKKIKGRFVTKADDETNITIYADPTRLSQIVDNLMTNAIKYSQPETEFTMSVEKQPEGWVISVEDQGQGIPQDELHLLFAPFSKTSVRTTSGESSTGLGLAIVKKLVETHKGTIWAESEVGKGSKFSFLLPGHKESS